MPLPITLGAASARGFGFGLVSAVTTWNPADVNADISLSNRNLTATRTSSAGGAAYPAGRATTSRSSGKYYFEATRIGTSQDAIGWANASYNIGSSTAMGNAANSVAYWAHDGTLRINGTVAAAQVLTNGETARLAIDFTNGNGWVGKVGSDWNGIPGADPSTNTDGFAFAAWMPGAVFPAVCINFLSAGFTLNCGQTAFLAAPPSGFSPWG